jgi:TupA-like ATPgrasp
MSNFTKKKYRHNFLFRTAYRLALILIPQNRFGDKFIAFCSFVLRHRRLPTNKLIFNDYLYKIKTSSEISNPLRVFVSDKEFVKIYVKAIVGDIHNVPTIAIIDNLAEIDNFPFPESCCIKPTHASGSLILRTHGEPVDVQEIRSWMSINYYKEFRELNYKLLQPKIIVEPLIFSSVNPAEYKFFCFNGKPKFVQVDLNRHDSHTQDFFDLTWKHLDFSILSVKCAPHAILKPMNFDSLVSIATELSKPFNLIRVDLYSDGSKIYVGELTNLHHNADGFFVPRAAEFTLDWFFEN